MQRLDAQGGNPVDSKIQFALVGSLAPDERTDLISLHYPGCGAGHQE
jgi:hypothetical protein